MSLSRQVIALLQCWHSRGVPLQLPPKESGKQEPFVLPFLYSLQCQFNMKLIDKYSKRVWPIHITIYIARITYVQHTSRIHIMSPWRANVASLTASAISASIIAKVSHRIGQWRGKTYNASIMQLLYYNETMMQLIMVTAKTEL